MAFSLEERAEFAARKRYELCKLLGGGSAQKGLHRLTLAERRAELLLDTERRRPAPAAASPRAPPAAAPTPAPAVVAESAATRRRKKRTGVQKERSLARLQEFQEKKRGQLYAACRLRGFLRRELRRLRWQRMQDVWTAYMRENTAQMQLVSEGSEPAAKRGREPPGDEQGEPAIQLAAPRRLQSRSETYLIDEMLGILGATPAGARSTQLPWDDSRPWVLVEGGGGRAKGRKPARRVRAR